MAERFSASRASRLMQCPGSADLEAAIPGWIAPVEDPKAGARGLGTMRHAFLEVMAKESATNIARMIEALTWYEDLRRTRRFKVLAEEEVQAEWLASKPTTTVDVVLYVQDEIHVIDWKAGGIEVYAENNTQGLFYAATFAHLAPKAKGVNIHIVQPWSTSGISSWFADTNVLAQFMADAIAAEDKVLSGDLTLAPGDACTFCPAYPHSRGTKGTPLCPAAMRLLYPRAPVDLDAILAL